MDGGRIVVGVDGSEESRAALRWAATEARIRAAELLVVHAWWALPELVLTEAADRGRAVAETSQASGLVDEFVLQTLGGTGGGLVITCTAIQGVTAATALLEAAEGAELLVLGSRGLGGFRGLLLGSVSQQCVHHAPCPVVVIRSRAGKM